MRDERRTGAAGGDVAKVADDLVEALMAGDADRLLSLLAPDVVLMSDGGAETHAARRPVVGPDRVARLMLNLARRGAALEVSVERGVVNGQQAMVARWGDAPVLVMALTVRDGHVAEVHSVLNPTKLAALSLTDPIV